MSELTKERIEAINKISECYLELIDVVQNCHYGDIMWCLNWFEFRLENYIKRIEETERENLL